jgi:hypothetical protein
MTDQHGPAISAEGIAFYRSQLTPSMERDFPVEFAALKASVTAALSATGQQLEAPGDATGRSEAAKLYDARHGITISADNKPALPGNLQSAIDREAHQEAPDAEEIASQLSAVGLDPAQTISIARAVLNESGSKVAPEKLSAPVIAQLRCWGEHLQQAKQSRPR